jgi:hypothetical protein
MDDQPNQPSPRQAKMKAIEALDASSIVNPGTQKRSVSTYESFDSPQKSPKTTPSARVDKGAEDVSTQFHRTPATKRLASHSGLIEKETIIYAPDMEAQIAAEARGVTRKNIPWDTFRSIYLCDFSTEAQSKLTVESVKKIGDDSWFEQPFWDRLRRGPILAPRPLTPKRTSLDLSWVMTRGICGTLSPSVYRPRLRFHTRPPSLSLGVYSLSNRTRAFNHGRNAIEISPCLLALDGSREPGRDVNGTREISTGWLVCTEP